MNTEQPKVEEKRTKLYRIFCSRKHSTRNQSQGYYASVEEFRALNRCTCPAHQYLARNLKDWKYKDEIV